MKTIGRNLSRLVFGLLVMLSGLSVSAAEIAWITNDKGAKVGKCVVEDGIIIKMDDIELKPGTYTFPLRTEAGSSITGVADYYGWYSFDAAPPVRVVFPEGYTKLGRLFNLDLSTHDFPTGFIGNDDAFVISIPSTMRELDLNSWASKIEIAAGNPYWIVRDRNVYYCENGDSVPTRMMYWLGSRADKVTIPATVTEWYDENEVLIACSGMPGKLKTIAVEAGNPAFKVENGLLLSKDGSILYKAVSEMSAITIPPSVREIRYCAFEASKAESLVIPDTVSFIGYGVTFWSKVKSVEVKGAGQYERMFEECAAWYPLAVTITSKALAGIDDWVGIFGEGADHKVSVVIKESDGYGISDVGNLAYKLIGEVNWRYSDWGHDITIYVDAADTTAWINKIKSEFAAAKKLSRDFEIKWTVKAFSGGGGGSSKPEKPVASSPKVNWTFDGYVLDGDSVAGLVTLTVAGTEAKPKLTAKVTTAGGNLALKGTSWVPAENVCCVDARWATMSAKGKTMTLTFCGNESAVGTLDGMPVYLDRNWAVDKAGQAAVKPFEGNYTAALIGENVTGYLQLSVKVAKGAVTVKGVMSDGSAVSAKSTLLVSDDEAYIPVFVTKKGKYTLSALLRITKDGLVESDLASIPRWETPGVSEALSMDGARFSPSAVEGEKVLTFDGLPGFYDKKLGDYLPAVGEASPDGLAMTIAKGKIVIPKATMPKKGADGYEYNGPTDAGVKLNYKPASGILSGSFKLYYDWQPAAGGKWQHKAVTAKLQGVAVGEGFVGFASVPQSNPALKKAQKTVSVPFVIE